MPNTKFITTGSYLPAHHESNAELEATLGLERGWIASRTGIEGRTIAGSDQAVSDLAVHAGAEAIGRFQEHAPGYPPIGTLILATSTPDHLLPPTSSQVATRLSLGAIAAMDLTVACSGFLYAMILADSLCQTQNRSVLIIAANVLSRRCRPDDANTRSIFSDAAGAIILSPTQKESSILATAWHSDGSQADNMLIPDGGSRSPINADSYACQRQFMQLNNGSAIFKSAVKTMGELGNDVVQKSGYCIDDIDWWIPHQASQRIIDGSRRLLRIPETKTLTTVKRYGNSSAASIPVTFDEFLNQQKVIGSGQLVLLTAAAVGMTGAAVLLRIP